VGYSAQSSSAIGAPEEIARATIHALDRVRGSGFPQKQAVSGK